MLEFLLESGQSFHFLHKYPTSKSYLFQSPNNKLPYRHLIFLDPQSANEFSEFRRLLELYRLHLDFRTNEIEVQRIPHQTIFS